MNQLTVRDLGDELGSIVRHLAKQEGISLNKAALKLLRKGAGLTDTKLTNPKNAIGTGLDHFFGTWSQEEADSFEAALEVFETVDDKVWSMGFAEGSV